MAIALSGSLILSGSITVSGSIISTGTISMSGSIASASYATNADLLDGLDSTVFTLTSSFNAQTASFTAFTSSINSFSASILAQTASLNLFSSSVLTFTGSASTRLDTLEAYTSSLNNKTSSFATTGSNTFVGNQVVSGSFTTSGSITSTSTITAQTLVVQTITSSVVYSSGSNIFGNDISNSQTFTGSVLITGSLTISTGGNASAPIIFGSTIACSPIGCFATSCATSFIGGTMSGTTIYGSTAVCSPVGKFSTCIDAGSGTFSDNVLISKANLLSSLTIKSSCSTTGLQLYLYGLNATLSNQDNGSLVFQTNGTDRLTIASTGAATFACSVTIEGNGSTIRSGNELRFNRTDNAIYTRMYDAGSLAANGFTLDNTNAEGFHFKNNGTTIMRMNSSGNVGIGTCTPTDKLDIYGNDTNGAIVVRGGSSQTGRNIYLFSGGISATGTLLGVTKCVNQFIYSNNSRLTIGTADAYSLGFSTSDTLRAIIDSSGIACFACSVQGNGGIFSGTGASAATIGGKAAAASGLTDKDLTLSAWYPTSGTNEYGGDLYLAAGRPTGGGSGKYGTVYIQAGIGNGTANVAGSVGTVIAANNTLLQFFTATSQTASPTERMRINSDGPVDVGGWGTGGNISLRIKGNSNQQVGFFNHDGQLYMPFLDTSTGTDLVLTSCGYINKKSSSIRYKENIEPIDIGLDFIMSLNAVKFNMKSDGLAQVGFVAEEFPDERLVTFSQVDIKDASKGLQKESINYAQITAPLVKAIQELQAQITELKNK